MYCCRCNCTAGLALSTKRFMSGLPWIRCSRYNVDIQVDNIPLKVQSTSSVVYAISCIICRLRNREKFIENNRVITYIKNKSISLPLIYINILLIKNIIIQCHKFITQVSVVSMTSIFDCWDLALLAAESHIITVFYHNLFLIFKSI